MEKKIAVYNVYAIDYLHIDHGTIRKIVNVTQAQYCMPSDNK